MKEPPHLIETESVHPAMADFFLDFHTAASMALTGIPNSGIKQDFFRNDSYENPVNYGDSSYKSDLGRLNSKK